MDAVCYEDEKQTTIYKCPRCGLETKFKRDYIQHLNRVNQCKPILSNIETLDILLELEKEYSNKPFVCEKCNKRFNHSSSMYFHRKECNGMKMNSTAPQESDNEDTVNVENRIADYASRGEFVCAYIYLIREREFLRLNEPVYKHGKTKLKTFSLSPGRLKAYKNGSELLLIKQVPIDLVDIIEKTITKAFLTQFVKHDDGFEYFIGDPEKMMNSILDIINKFNDVPSENTKDSHEAA